MRRVTPRIKKMLAEFLAEDGAGADVTSALLPSDAVITASIITREPAVVSGTAYAREIFASGGVRCSIKICDCQRAGRGDEIINLRGNASVIISRERTALNLLSRMCGIATATADLASGLPAGVHLYATRKTAPGLRLFDKEAVEDGGGKRHRMGLGKSVMIKDNHIAAEMRVNGGKNGDAIMRLIRSARRKYGGKMPIEVEVESAKNAILAASKGASAVMLDNFTPARARAAIQGMADAGLRDSVSIEVSGGITRRNIGSYAECGADMISAGFITDSVVGIDVSLEV